MTYCQSDPRTELLESLSHAGLLIDAKCDVWDIDETLRTLLERQDRLRGDGLRPGGFYTRPLKAQVDLTTRCNLHCCFCYNDSGHAAAREFSRDDLIRVCDELGQLGVLQLVLSGGEVLCRPEILFAVVQRARDQRMGIRIVTNGWFVDEQAASRLAQLPISDVQVSIDGALPVVHDQLRGRAGSWKRAISAASTLARNGVHTSVACVVTPSNRTTLPELAEMACLIGASRLVIADVIRMGRAVSSFGSVALDDETYEWVYSTVRELRQRYSNQLAISLGTDIGVSLRFAIALNDTVCYIRPDGSVCPSCLIPLVFGNVHRDPLGSIWLGMRGLWRHQQVLQYAQRFELRQTPNLGLTRSVFVDLPTPELE